MPTISDLVEDVAAGLRGYVRNQEQVTYLTADVTDSDTTFLVGNGSRISPGRLSVGDEIVEVDSVDGNTVNVFPFGRGADGSTAAAHTANTRVVANPLFPRHRVMENLVDSVRSVATQVPGVGQYEFTFDAGTAAFDLPSDLAQIISVQAERPGLVNHWETVNRFRIEKQAESSAFPGGNSIVPIAGAWPGKKVLVTYTKTAPAVISPSDDVVSDFGLRPTLRDVITMGTVARILSMVDISSLDPSSVQALMVDEKRMPGSSGKVVSQLWALYRERLEEERSLFLRQNPVHVRYER